MLYSSERLQEAIAKFPATFGLRAFPGEVFRVSKAHSYINDVGEPMLYTERKTGPGQYDWASFAKGTVKELDREVIR